MAAHSLFFQIKKYFRRFWLSAFCGVLAGTSSSVFLFMLTWSKVTRESHPQIIWGLPIIGLLIGWVYFKFGHTTGRGNNLIIDEIHDPKNVVPVRMAPFILFGTFLTNLFGGSAGREGAAVQMAASLSDQLSHVFKIDSAERKMLLVASAGAGFGSAISTPLAGVIFGMEMIGIGRLRFVAWFECLVASFVAFYVTRFLGAPHALFPKFDVPDFDTKTLACIIVAGIFFGLASRVFVHLTHLVERANARFIKYPPLMPFVAGIIIVFLYWLDGTYRYSGLGLQVIQGALSDPASLRDPALKAFFTALTVGSGFKGGEFIPLVYIGTTLGSALATLLPISFKLLAAVGFAAVFGAAANTPIACTIMAMEIFGASIGIYAFVGCIVAYLCSGHRGIYKTQRVDGKKSDRLKFRLPIGPRKLR